MNVGKEFVIETTESLSEAVDTELFRRLGIAIPSTWDTAGVTFQVSVGGDVFVNLYKADGSAEYALTAGAGTAIPLDPDIFGPWRFIKLRSGTAASAVAQSGIEAKKEITVATGKTLTFTSGVGGTDPNNLTVTIATNDTDDLAASISGYDLLVELASQTAAKNTDELIEDAVQALVDTGSVNLTLMTVVGNDAYDAAEPVGTVASKVITVATGKTLTFATVLKGEQYNDIAITMETADDDTLAVSKIDDTDGILIKLANTTASKNAAAALQTAIQTVAATYASKFDISGMTVTANEAYTSAPLAGVKASKIFTLDTDKTLTVTSGVVGDESNAIKFTFGVNEDETDHDTLSVTAADDTITILLADTTGSNNAAAAIEAAIRLIEGGTVADVDITGMTVTGSTEYNEAPCTALVAEVEIIGVALADGADSIAEGLVKNVALAGGTDSIAAGLVDHVNLEGGDDCRVKLICRE